MQNIAKVVDNDPSNNVINKFIKRGLAKIIATQLLTSHNITTIKNKNSFENLLLFIYDYIDQLILKIAALIDLSSWRNITVVDVINSLKIHDIYLYRSLQNDKIENLSYLTTESSNEDNQLLYISVRTNTIENNEERSKEKNFNFISISETYLDVAAENAFKLYSKNKPDGYTPYISYEDFACPDVILPINDNDISSYCDLRTAAKSRSNLDSITKGAKYSYNVKDNIIAVECDEFNVLTYKNIIYPEVIIDQQYSLVNYLKRVNTDIKIDSDPFRFSLPTLPILKPSSVYPWMPIPPIEELLLGSNYNFTNSDNDVSKEGNLDMDDDIVDGVSIASEQKYEENTEDPCSRIELQLELCTIEAGNLELID